MPIPESQLETWSHQGAITTARQTHESIRSALADHSFPSGVDYEIYLQGSYKNSTNIRGDSDVDVVVQVNSTFYNNLTEDQKRSLNLTDARYNLGDFRRDVLSALQNYYGARDVSFGNKAIKVETAYLPADVVVCAQYRNYHSLATFNYTEGMTFYSYDDSRWTINYPKLHYDNGVSKQAQTQNWFKPTVRLFKNVRSAITDGGRLRLENAPSYFIECLLYNVPNTVFGNSYQDTLVTAFNYLNSADLDQCSSQNGQLRLFGASSEQWSQPNADSFLFAIRDLWNNW